MENPAKLKITIVTVCRNSEKFLEETIVSIINQTYSNIEYIVVDGASTDGTLDIIKKYSPDIDTWLSEPDKGMYEAMNKGLTLATGDFILVLNSDDMLASNNTITNVVDLIRDERPDYFYGNLIKFKNEKYREVKFFPVSFEQLLLSTHCTFVHHSCFFISNKLNKAIGGYDDSYKNVSDYDYILKALSAKGAKGKYLNIFISKFRLHENSTYLTVGWRIKEEREKILTHYGYFKRPYIKRMFWYYSLWIYYKLINIDKTYRAR